jgi:hypothetical protein
MKNWRDRLTLAFAFSAYATALRNLPMRIDHLSRGGVCSFGGSAHAWHR